jgi:hypothetical protein
MNTGLHLIEHKSGRWGFVGKVPTDLAFDCDDSELIRIACHCGPGFAKRAALREGKRFAERTWDSYDDALDAARVLHHYVEGS